MHLICHSGRGIFAKANINALRKFRHAALVRRFFMNKSPNQPLTTLVCRRTTTPYNQWRASNHPLSSAPLPHLLHLFASMCAFLAPTEMTSDQARNKSGLSQQLIHFTMSFSGTDSFAAFNSHGSASFISLGVPNSCSLVIQAL